MVQKITQSTTFYHKLKQGKVMSLGTEGGETCPMTGAQEDNDHSAMGLEDQIQKVENRQQKQTAK